MRSVKRTVRHAAFAARLAAACESNPDVPDLNAGRLTWIRAMLKERFDVSISLESISKWYNGESLPRQNKLGQLAEILGVDITWLQHGIDNPGARQGGRQRSADVGNMVRLLAGFISMDGGAVGYPDHKDLRAKSEMIDLYAIFGGRNHFIHIAPGRILGGTYSFTVPQSYESVTVLGSVREGTCLHLTELSSDLIRKRGTRRGLSIEVSMTEEEFSESAIQGFREPL